VHDAFKITLIQTRSFGGDKQADRAIQVDLVYTMTTDDENVAAYTSGAITRRAFMGNVELDVEGILDKLDEIQEVVP